VRRQLPAYSPLAVDAVARSLLVRGSESTDRLRVRLAAKFGADPEAVVLTGSGTQALGLAIALAVRARSVGRVALPAYTCWDVGTAVQSAGATASYFDIDPDDLTPDLESFESALRGGVAAAVVSPLYGYPVSWDEIRKLCGAHGCVLIEDAAQGHGMSWHGRPVGSLGDLSMVSFGRGKGWTGGGGGALLKRPDRLRSDGHVDPLLTAGPRGRLTWTGLAFAQALLGRPSLYGLPASLPGAGVGETSYHPPRDAMTMLPPTAALVLRMESRADEEADVRRRIGSLLLQRLKPASQVHAIQPSLPGAGFLRLAVRIPDASRSWERSVRRLGVARGYPLALPDVPELTAMSVGPTEGATDLPGARTLARELFTLPTHSLLREDDLDRIVAALSGT